jgi:hypothetical protein
MSRWKEEFVGNAQKKCVNVHHNGNFESGKGTFELFLVVSSNKLMNLQFCTWNLNGHFWNS